MRHGSNLWHDAVCQRIRTVGLYDTGDLSGYHDVVVERTLEIGKELIRQGAEAIIPLGGKIILMSSRPKNWSLNLGVPVINTKRSE